MHRFKLRRDIFNGINLLRLTKCESLLSVQLRPYQYVGEPLTLFPATSACVARQRVAAAVPGWALETAARRRDVPSPTPARADRSSRRAIAKQSDGCTNKIAYTRQSGVENWAAPNRR